MNLLLDECSRRYGQPYVPQAAESHAIPSLSPYRFTVVDVRTAAQFGYHDPLDELSFAFSLKHPVVVPPGHPTSKVVLDGPSTGEEDVPTDPNGKPVPVGGCRRLVDEDLVRTPAFAGKVNDYLEALNTRIRHDSRLDSIMRAWVDCMKAEGYSYENPLDPVRKYGSRPTISAEEAKVAVADATCKQKTNYVGKRLQIESAYDRESLDADPVTWNGYRVWVERRNKRVEEVLASRGQ